MSFSTRGTVSAFSETVAMAKAAVTPNLTPRISTVWTREKVVLVRVWLEHSLDDVESISFHRRDACVLRRIS